jgi:hypothetical protein
MPQNIYHLQKIRLSYPMKNYPFATYWYFLLTLLIMTIACSDPQQPAENPQVVHIFDVASLSQTNAALQKHPGGGWLYKPGAPGKPLEFGKGMPAWAQAQYLVVELENLSPFSLIVYLDFFREQTETQTIRQQGEQEATDKPRISAKIGILPNLPTQMIFPLNYLDGEDIFLPRYPRQLKGTVLGSRLSPEDIARVVLRLEPHETPDFLPALTIRKIWLSKALPTPLPPPAQPVVDQFGQWTARDWPGKIKSEETLTENLQKLAASAQNAQFPEAWSHFGGWKQKKFKATGFFRTEHDGQRWWLVDPEGYAFLSMGMDCVRDYSNGPFAGQEDLFTALPNGSDPLFAPVYSERRGTFLVDYYKTNLIRTFGSQWREKWETMTKGLLMQARFNTVANWSDHPFTQTARLPYVFPLADFPYTEVLLFRDFPDVFSEEYREKADQFAQQLIPLRNDPYLIGYFLRNEPHWAFGYHNVAYEMFGTGRQSVTKTAFVQWLAERYQQNVASWNVAWGTSFKTFNDLLKATFKEMPGGKAEGDFYAFSEIMVEKYVGIVCDEVEKVDNNHLNLGMRYAWLISNLLYKAGERFDVFSINGYSSPGPPATSEIARISGKPIMIGEFHFGTADRGLPANGIQAVTNQQERAKAYQYYMEQGFARPEVVGLHYFQWNDQPITGRYDGENYNIGFLDITVQPYPELFQAAKQSHERMYHVATGLSSPYDSLAKKAPQIYY